MVALVAVVVFLQTFNSPHQIGPETIWLAMIQKDPEGVMPK